MTEEYQVIVTQDAEDDLNALDDYITEVYVLNVIYKKRDIQHIIQEL